MFSVHISSCYMIYLVFWTLWQIVSSLLLADGNFVCHLLLIATLLFAFLYFLTPGPDCILKCFFGLTCNWTFFTININISHNCPVQWICACTLRYYRVYQCKIGGVLVQSRPYQGDHSAFLQGIELGLSRESTNVSPVHSWMPDQNCCLVCLLWSLLDHFPMLYILVVRGNDKLYHIYMCFDCCRGQRCVLYLIWATFTFQVLLMFVNIWKNLKKWNFWGRVFSDYRS